MSRTAAALLLLAFLAAPGAAQEAPRVQPGGIATVIVTLPPTADSVSYALTLAPGVRTFARTTGSVASTAGDPIRIPLTFGIPAGAAAGSFVAGELTVVDGNGGRETRDLVVDVLPRRRARLVLDATTMTATAGSTVELGYRLWNEGNAVDTFTIALAVPSTWAAPAPSAEVVIEPGGVRSGSFRANVPASAVGAREHLMRVTATGADVREAAASRVTIVLPESSVGNLVTIPGSIFVGSSAGDGGTMPAVAVTAAGEVRPGVRLRMDVRHSDDLSPAYALRGALSGPQLRLGLDGDRWSARAGDIFSLPSLVTGPMSQGRGVEGSYAVGSLRTDLFIARPWSYGHNDEDGHLVRASARYVTDLGTFGARAGSVARRGGFLDDYRQAGGVATYSVRRGAHDLNVEAGVMEVATDSVSTIGPSAELRYSVNTERVSVAARLRRVPGTTSRTASQGNEAFVSGSYALSRSLRLMGTAYTADASRIDDAPQSASRGTSLGLRLSTPFGFNARVQGAYRSTEQMGARSRPTTIERRVLTLGADVPAGPVTLQATMDIGRGGLFDRPYHSARAGARWQGAGQWAWIGLSRYDQGLGATTSVDMSGSARFRAAELEGGLSAPVASDHRLRSTSFWSSLTVPVMPNTGITMGAEYRGFSAAPWRFALGVRRNFGMPLPVRRAPILQGVVFEDLDGDGIRGPGEQPMSGVGVSLGPLYVETDAEGRFRFYDAVAGELRIDRSGLPMGVTIADGEPLPTRGSATIGVARTGTIELRAFLDRNSDGVQDAGEVFAPNAIVTVIDGDGVSRDALTDASGRARFSGLRPGNYTVLVHRADGRTAPQPVQLDVVLHPGVTEQLLIAVPYRTMEIRMPNGASLDTGGATRLPSDQPAESSRDRAVATYAQAEAPVTVDSTAIATGGGSNPTAEAGRGATAQRGPAPARTNDVVLVRSARNSPVENRHGSGAPPRDTLTGLLVALILLIPGFVSLEIRRRHRERFPEEAFSAPTA